MAEPFGLISHQLYPRQDRESSACTRVRSSNISSLDVRLTNDGTGSAKEVHPSNKVWLSPHCPRFLVRLGAGRLQLIDLANLPQPPTLERQKLSGPITAQLTASSVCLHASDATERLSRVWNLPRLPLWLCHSHTLATKSSIADVHPVGAQATFLLSPPDASCSRSGTINGLWNLSWMLYRPGKTSRHRSPFGR